MDQHMKDVTCFSDAYIERCDKETEKVITEETSSFLTQPIKHLQIHKNEFIYLESELFEKSKIDAVSLEVDDAFCTYDVMVGLKLQKKFEATIRTYLQKELNGDGAKFDLIFNHDDGLWDLNFTLDFVDGFNNELSIGEAYSLIYNFLTKLVKVIEDDK